MPPPSGGASPVFRAPNGTARSARGLHIACRRVTTRSDATIAISDVAQHRTVLAGSTQLAHAPPDAPHLDG